MTNKCVSFFAVHLDSICFAHTSCLQKKMIALSARVMVGSKWRKKKKAHIGRIKYTWHTRLKAFSICAYCFYI